jgi:hypothetical protein
LGAEARLTAADVRWLSPLPLWAGLLSGPTAWGLDLGVSYALVKWACAADGGNTLRLMSVAALAMVAGGALVSWQALRTARGEPGDGGTPRQRAHFMAVLGLTSSALFALAIVAGAVPRWMLDACQ